MTIIEVSIVFEWGARIGPDGAKLLGNIRKTGSISAAARRAGMPYKKAWILIDGLNHAFREPVITAAPGGAGGGGATLTPFGAELLERYERIAARAAEIVAGDIAALSRDSEPSQAGSRQRVEVRFGRRRVPRTRRKPS